jgi:dTDP-4-dehydrorhamnose reductase
MSNHNNRYEEDFINDALNLILEKNRSVHSVSKDLGVSGLVGKALVKEFDDKYDVYGTSSEKSFRLDISNIENIHNILNKVEPSIVISSLRGEFDLQTNLHKEVAKYLQNNGGKLYFYSTVNVFDIDVCKPHYENDETESESEYGKFKIQCKKELKEILGNNLIVLRLPMIWGKESPRITRVLTVERAAKIHRVPLDEFLSMLKKACETKK